MPKKTKMVQNHVLQKLIEKSASVRAFAREISEDPADIIRWRNGQRMPVTRAVITMCRLYGVKPNQLNPELFPEDVELVFKKKGK